MIMNRRCGVAHRAILCVLLLAVLESCFLGEAFVPLFGSMRSLNGQTTPRGRHHTTAIASSSVWGMNSTVWSYQNDNTVAVPLPLSSSAPWEDFWPTQPDPEKPKQYRVYCDLDGVLVDFAHGVTEAFDLDTPATSQNIDAMVRTELWEGIQKADAFFQNLSWCADGQRLWEAISPLRPDILTGVPSYCDKAPRQEKYAWCQRELSGPVDFRHVDKAGRFRMHYPVNGKDDSTEETEWQCRVITCWSERKHHESGPGVVLIDDRLDLKLAWEAAGGIFIHHRTGDTDRTLRQLYRHGILAPAMPQKEIDPWHSATMRP